MNIDKWLSRASNIQNEIEELEDMKRKAYEKATRTTSNPEAVIVSTSGDPHHKIESINDYIASLEGYQKKLLQTECEILEAIMLINSSTERSILNRYYLKGEPVSKIAIEFNYSERNIYRIIDKCRNEIKLKLCEKVQRDSDTMIS